MRSTLFLAGLLAALPLVAPPAVAGEFTVDAALGHLLPSEADTLGDPTLADLEVRRAHAWAGGTHVRFAQSWRGVPILDREVIVSLDLQDRPYATVGEIERIPWLPAVVASRAAALDAADTFRAGLGAGSLWDSRASEAIWIDRRGVPRRVWEIHASTAEPLMTWRILVDAHGGRVIDFGPTSWHARGNVYPENPSTSSLTEVDLGDITDLHGPYATVVSCDVYETGQFGGGTCTEVSSHAEPDAEGDFLFPSDPVSDWDPLAEVQMYYHLDRLSKWFEDVLGFRHEGPGGIGIPIQGVVNFDFNNAIYGDIDGDNTAEVAFGQTSTFDYAYDADVIIHEFGHSVFGQIVQSGGFFESDEYGLEFAAGGLNEGTADVFTMIRHPDPIVGEYAGQGVGIRNLDADRHCPTDLYGQSHRDGETWGAFLWNVLEDPRSTPDEVSLVLYGALGTWPTDVNWEFAGNSIADAAERLADEGIVSGELAEAFHEHGERSGVVGCGRVIALDDGQEPTQLLFHSQLAGEEGGIPLAQQFSIEAPELTEQLRFRVKDLIGGPPALDYRVYMNRGEFVFHETVDIPTQFGTIQMPVPEDYEAAFDGDGADFEIILDADSDPPLEPGATYYFAIGSRATGNIDGFFVNAEITVDADIVVGEAPTDDADDVDDDAGGQSCSDCGASMSVASSGGLVALLPLLLVRRRRGRVASYS